MINKPAPEEYNPFYETYISQIENDDLLSFLRAQAEELPQVFGSVSEEGAKHRYAEGKWSIAELLNHINDAERVFSYRAFAIARGEKQALPGMDQDDYADAARTDARTYASLIEEFKAVRAGTLTLLETLDDERLSLVGTASGFPVTPRGLAGIIAGHAQHHLRILKERYL